MKYRIYVFGTGGPTDLGTYEPDETILCLDWLLLEQKTKEKVMAIECNLEDNIEFPALLYLGNLADYDDFKRYLNNQDEVRITKQFRKRRWYFAKR